MRLQEKLYEIGKYMVKCIKAMEREMKEPKKKVIEEDADPEESGSDVSFSKLGK